MEYEYNEHDNYNTQHMRYCCWRQGDQRFLAPGCSMKGGGFRAATFEGLHLMPHDEQPSCLVPPTVNLEPLLSGAA
jgi:hypothetical protein